MHLRKKVLAISGSTRQQSVNRLFINAVAKLGIDRFDVEIYDSIVDIPHFNPDADTLEPPTAVGNFREKVRKADGVFICSPEYAMGVPGSLKNALDWTVGTSDFSNKPVALITASFSGLKAHESLLGTLRVIEARVAEESQLVISFAKTKVNAKATITDEATLTSVRKLIHSFVVEMNKE